MSQSLRTIPRNDQLTDWDYQHVFIDWLTVREPNNGQYPILNSGVVIKIDPEGETVYETALTRHIEGSYSSNAAIRVTEAFREISFNPSRYSRPDNLFGHRLESAVLAVNVLLKQIGQPPLSNQYHFNRIDVTLNIETGSAGNLHAYLRDLQKRTLPRMRTTTYEGSVVYKAKSKSITVYAKHLEMRKHKSPYLEYRPYREKVARWCEQKGVARIECRFRRDWLKRHNLQQCQDHHDLVEAFKREVIKMQKASREEDTDMLTHSELGTLLMWKSGYYVKEMMAKNTFYSRRNAIREKTGYDIGAEPPLKFTPKTIKFTTKSAVPPEWYSVPEVS